MIIEPLSVSLQYNEEESIPTMKLDQLLKAIQVPSTTIKTIADIQIANICFNSKQVELGDLFVAISGYSSDGHDYISDAIVAGATAVVGEKPVQSSCTVPYYQVPNARLALAQLAAEHCGYPYLKHNMIGITGTNGKTTTAHMIRQILETSQQSCSMSSTIEQYVNGQSLPSKMTTHDAVQAQKMLKQSEDDHVILEVSSHGLTQRRLDGMQFDFAVFTNLSHEHLDYHSSIEKYFDSKMQLFELLKSTGEAIVNIDSPWGQRLAQELTQRGTSVYTFGINNPSASLNIVNIQHQLKPVIKVHEQEDNRSYSITLAVPGLHNILNAAAAILLARRMSISVSNISQAFSTFQGVSGRLETFQHPNGAMFIIDYAHTPDGLQQCLESMSVHKPSRLIHIFGFRGARDDTKWDSMVDISNQVCEQTILTLDDLNQIPQAEMLSRYRTFINPTTRIVEDRTLAISHAWRNVQPGDCVVITGKGPEPYQQTFALPAQSDQEMIHHLYESEDSKQKL